MHRTILLALAAGMLSLLVGCSGTLLRGDATLTEVSNKAVVVLSVSHDIEAGDGAKAIFYLDEDRYPGRVVMTSVKDTLSIATKSDFGVRRGHLYVLELEQGSHEIKLWQVYSAGARLFPKEMPPPLKFEVRAGEALYLGNLHAKLTLGHTLLFGGGRAAYGAIPNVEDQSKEDIALAEAMVPALKGRVKKAVLPLGPWTRTGETIKKIDKIDPIPLPVIPVKR
jgi:hypothetical protein